VIVERPLVIVGATTSGKSNVALDVVRRRQSTSTSAEIISCDSMAVYRGMDIGTASPSAAARAEVPHHLLDVIDPNEEYSVSEFAPAVTTVLADLHHRRVAAVLVGGTGLYVRAVTDQLALPPRFDDVAAELDTEPDTGVLFERLIRLDPIAATRIPPGNRRRVLRALEVTIGSGRPFSDSGPGLAAYPANRYVQVGLRVPRDILEVRIRSRLQAQLDSGLLAEVERLRDVPGGPSRTAREALGYRELLAYLRNETSLQDAIELIVVRTRRLAVRQVRWFRRDPRITWFDALDTDPADLAGRIDRHWSEVASGSPPVAGSS